MGELFGGGSAKRAAQQQAAAIDRQTRSSTINTNYQIQSMADQLANAAAAQTAREYAEQLLSRPLETVDVTLGTSDLDVRTDNLLGRRRPVRSAYFGSPTPPTAASRVTAQQRADLL